MKNFIRILLVVGCIMAALPGKADLFSSKDDAFSLDMPTGWKRVNTDATQSMLSLQKADARLDIKQIDCTTESCLDQYINRDLAEVKAKQMTVIKNTYTGDEIKRVEFSSGEPFYYISFYTPKNDFSAGYFLIDGKGYSILTKNVTYAETDLIFTAIAPTRVTAPQPATTDLAEAAQTLDILPIDDIQTAQELGTPDTPAQTSSTAGTKSTLQSLQISHKAKEWKNGLSRLRKFTFLSAHMPPYIRAWGHGYDLFLMIFLLFATLWFCAGLVRLFVRPMQIELPANPNSLYPIKLERLYGTPSLIFRAKDNQGNVLTALSTRWDALLMFLGIILMLLALVGMGIMSLCQQIHLVANPLLSNTVYSSTALILPIGLLLFFCGAVWSQIYMTDITLFDRQGKKAAVILQKGYSLSNERYQIYFVHSKELLIAQRKRFTLRRQWQLLSKDNVEFASITETSAKRACWRMLCGHLWGMLRADYQICGMMESEGVLQNTHALFNKLFCNMDKPEAVNARDLLAISLLISIRDRDKWYPWFN